VLDYVIVRSNGEPLYTLVNPVDDALMGITHVLRGEDLLSSTPRQVALYGALQDLGVADVVPRFGHLPYVMGEGNKKLSKRDPQSSLNAYREGGFVPEGLLNYLALLGWSIAEDRDIFSMAEMAEAFDIGRVNPNPARFDLKKCTAINADWIRRLEPADLAGRLEVFLQGAGILPETPSAAQRALLAAATPLVQERMTTLAEGPGMLGFLFADGPVAVEPDARAALPDVAGEVLDAALAALDGLDPFDAATVEGALRAALVDGLGLKPKVAFGPVRVAVTGRRVSPPLFESMELLGAPAALERLRGLRASL
jgi:glutamyl-tRNA synthetase